MEYDRIITGDSLTELKKLPDGCVNCCVTSPPYWKLRDYKMKEQIGMEATPQGYIDNLVQVFAEVRRVMKDDGTLWINIGDSYSKGSNIRDCFNAVNKFRSICFMDAFSIRITSHCIKVSGNDKFPENDIFISLFSVKRIFIKKRDNNFCKVFNIFNGKGYALLSGTFCLVKRDVSTLEIVFNEMDNVSIIHSNLKSDLQSEFGISIFENSCENEQATLSIKKPGKPISEPIFYSHSDRYSITLNPSFECVVDVNFVHKPVPFADTLGSSFQSFGDLQIRKSTVEEIDFFFSDLGIYFTSNCVGHIYYLNSKNSILSHSQMYEKATHSLNALQEKQEIGIPDLLKRALQEDGWICRSTIIWAKKNCMPESVTDRPTSAHEHIFLLTKSAKYFYDHEAIKEPAIYDVDGTGTAARKARQKDDNKSMPEGIKAGIRPAGFKDAGLMNGKHSEKQRGHSRRHNGFNDRWDQMTHAEQCTGKRNKRNVWHMATAQFPEAHFAVFPEELPHTCILAGCPDKGIVLDPFAGSGTTLLQASKLGRHYLGIELNPEYVQIAENRLKKDLGLFY